MQVGEETVCVQSFLVWTVAEEALILHFEYFSLCLTVLVSSLGESHTSSKLHLLSWVFSILWTILNLLCIAACDCWRLKVAMEIFLVFCCCHPWNAFAALFELPWWGMTSILCIDLCFSDTFLIAVMNEYGKKFRSALLYEVAAVCKEVMERRCVKRCGQLWYAKYLC